MSSKTAETDTYTKDKRGAVSWIAGILGALLIGAMCFVASQLGAHETGIAVIRGRQDTQEKRLDQFDAKLDKILDRLPARTTP